MSIQIIQDRVSRFSPQSKQEEEHALKEIYQEIALSALSRSGFFKIAAFQGGTCLRIIHGLNRFSEDLDFILTNPNKEFAWEPFLKNMQQEFAIYGVELKAEDRTKAPGPIQRAFLKQDSFGKILQLAYERNASDRQQITIRLEVDTHPPSGSIYTNHHLDFPTPFTVVAQDRASLFASKCHALLCRLFLKGRDWYDFLWYVTNKISVNLAHLTAALVQTGHWTKQDPVTKNTLADLLRGRIHEIDWRVAGDDVINFLRATDREIVRAWSKTLFLDFVDKLQHYLTGPLKPVVLYRIGLGPAPKMDSKLFSGAITKMDQEQIDLINASESFWCQPLDAIDNLKNTSEYEVVFFHLDDPGHNKPMAAKTSHGSLTINAVPGQRYTLPGWFIKDWNGRRLVHYQGIHRAPYWFQPIHLASTELVKAMESYAKASL